MAKLQITLEIQDEYVTTLENYLAEHFNLISCKIIPDTTELYKTDKRFKKLAKAVKDARIELEEYTLSKL